MFEIIMTNGKRKVLAAETAALREEWVRHLWQAMNLSTSVLSESRSTRLEVCEQRERLNSSVPVGSHSDSVMELLPARPLSAPDPTGHILHETPVCPSEALISEEATYQNTQPLCSHQHHSGEHLNGSQGSSVLNNAESMQEGDYDILPLRNSLNGSPWSRGLNNAEGRPEADYDILPLRNKVFEVNASAGTDEGVYDFPLSYRRTAEHPNPTESIYDVPSSLLRRMPDHTLENQPDDGVYWRI
ncbi:uncharacterized protein LOC121957058 [Plectropomus leopardus]|uniref:uncharacterized protein LOC121957058 n=1 Tax=Plectropomus leopardus TaxID=160734 RepID=UPI001C4B1E4C|nr:uncharacterized protein LOC121957058 [Plectropomus leopardus]